MYHMSKYIQTKLRINYLIFHHIMSKTYSE